VNGAPERRGPGAAIRRGTDFDFDLDFDLDLDLDPDPDQRRGPGGR
jgi:hypothetical protein